MVVLLVPNPPMTPFCSLSRDITIYIKHILDINIQIFTCLKASKTCLDKVCQNKCFGYTYFHLLFSSCLYYTITPQLNK